MNTEPHGPKQTAALDAILRRDGAHHLEIDFDEEGLVESVTSADEQWDEVRSYVRGDLSAEERRQAEALFEPDGVVYPDMDG
ncbi:hypothetical protein HUW46_09203 [Amycolatopsis sp. CA-230715]|nr:hypothetical protein HUW46_09203 [Amycolatopsis sp. CA-230715]